MVYVDSSWSQLFCDANLETLNAKRTPTIRRSGIGSGSDKSRMRFDEFGVLFVWWGVWSLSDKYLLPYSPWTESAAILLGFTVSRIFAPSQNNSFALNKTSVLCNEEATETPESSIRRARLMKKVPVATVYTGELQTNRVTESRVA